MMEFAVLECEANAMAAKEEKFLTVKDASEFLGVAPNTLRAWGAAGKVDEYRHPINNYRLYLRKELTQLKKRLAHPKVRKEKGRDKT